jgi:SRSO17 transposase
MDRLNIPLTDEPRFAAYLEALSGVLGHADRIAPLKAYCTGLLLPGARKSIEPKAARIAPACVQATHQALHHFEPRRVFRRPFGLGQAAKACTSA